MRDKIVRKLPDGQGDTRLCLKCGDLLMFHGVTKAGVIRCAALGCRCENPPLPPREA